jgi:hypothetical protein
MAATSSNHCVDQLTLRKLRFQLASYDPCKEVDTGVHGVELMTCSAADLEAVVQALTGSKNVDGIPAVSVLAGHPLRRSSNHERCPAGGCICGEDTKQFDDT